LRGSLFVPAGGQYYLKVTDGTAPAGPGPATNAAPATTNAAPARSDEVPSVIVPEATAPVPVAPAAAWHLEIVQIPATVSSTDALTVFTPYFVVPDAPITTVTPPPPPPPPQLTQDQINALVTIKGDTAQGNGFLMRAPDGVYVVAHLRLLANNPNLQIFTSSGAAIKVLALKAATDRNLVLIAVQNDNFKCLPAPKASATSPAVGDAVIIPVIGKSDLDSGKVGKIVEMSPERIDFDAQVDISSNSEPVIAVNSGQALGIVTAEKQVDLTETTARAWAENPAPGSANIVPYFGLALTNVAGWEPLDLAAFGRESALLSQFHETTRCLDSYLNGRHRQADEPPAAATSPPDSKTYTSNAQIAAAHATYQRQATDTDHEEQLDAARELLDDLQSVAATDVAQVRSTNFAYALNRRRAQEELAYRKSIQAQLDALTDNIARLNDIAQKR
jgi:hypothetical protein